MGECHVYMNTKRPDQATRNRKLILTLTKFQNKHKPTEIRADHNSQLSLQTWASFVLHRSKAEDWISRKTQEDSLCLHSSCRFRPQSTKCFCCFIHYTECNRSQDFVPLHQRNNYERCYSTFLCRNSGELWQFQTLQFSWKRITGSSAFFSSFLQQNPMIFRKDVFQKSQSSSPTAHLQQQLFLTSMFDGQELTQVFFSFFFFSPIPSLTQALKLEVSKIPTW